MKKLLLGLMMLVMILAACGPKYPTPDMLYGSWEGDHRTLTFREFNNSDSYDLRVIGAKNQHGVLHIDANNEDNIDAVWWLNDKGMLIITVEETTEIVGLGTSSTKGYMYGVEEVTSETLVIWPLTGGEKRLESFQRK